MLAPEVVLHPRAQHLQASKVKAQEMTRQAADFIVKCSTPIGTTGGGTFSCCLLVINRSCAQRLSASQVNLFAMFSSSQWLLLC